MNWKILIATGGILFSSTICAKTPDGETPANEGVCESESGAAYGLCVSYCEAMDCDGDDPLASDEACESVARNFKKLSGEESLPCEEVVCPCASDQIWIDVLADSNFNCGPSPYDGGDHYYVQSSTNWNTFLVNDDFYCSAFLVGVPDDGHEISAEESDACDTLMFAVAFDYGNDCTTPFPL